MNDWAKLSRQADEYKKTYPVGTRIVLIHMDDPWAPVPAGTRGTVKFVDDAGQIHMSWDNDRTLALVPGEDLFRKLTEQELEAEKEEQGLKRVDDLIFKAAKIEREQFKGMPEDKAKEVFMNVMDKVHNPDDR